MSWTLPKGLLDRPEAGRLATSVQRLMRRYRQDLVALVLFGSMARGDHDLYSDYDLLLVLERDPERFIDRLVTVADQVDPRVEVLAYTVPEVEQLWATRNLLLLDALDEGKVLVDNGFWMSLRQRLLQEVAAGRLRRYTLGWEIRPGPGD